MTGESLSIELTRRLHDGHLEAVRVDGQRHAYLACRALDGSPCEIVLEGIVDLSCNNFRQGNIILDVTVSRTSDFISREEWALLCQTDDPGKVAQYRHRLETMDVHYFLLTSSYGAEVVAVCARVSVTG